MRHISVRGGMDAVLHLYETLQADLFLIFFNEDSAGEFVVFSYRSKTLLSRPFTLVLTIVGRSDLSGFEVYC